MPVRGTPQGSAVVLGERELRRALGYLGRRGLKRAMASGIRAGMTVIRKAIRRQVTATQVDTPHAASLKTGVRKAVKSRFARKKPRDGYEAVIGFAVGMRGEKRLARLSRGETHGAGVSAADVHWFAMTGRSKAPPMEPQFEGVVRRAHAASAQPAMARAAAKTRERIRVEAIKARRGG